MNKSLLNIFFALVLTACSAVQSDELSNYPEDGVVRVRVGVETRASYTSDNLEQFAITIVNPESETYSYNNFWAILKNGEWYYDGNNGRYKILLWQNEKQPVNILAYAPTELYIGFGPSSIDQKDYAFSVKQDQSSKDDTGSDFIVCKRVGFVPKTDLNTSYELELNFKHVLSLLKINIILGNEYNRPTIPSENPIKSVSVGGTILDALCDLSQSPATASANEGKSPLSVTAACTNWKKSESENDNARCSYECILVPQTVAAGGFSVSLSIDGVIYEWKSSLPVTFESGKSHELTLRMGKDVVLVGDITSLPWDANTPVTDIETD